MLSPSGRDFHPPSQDPSARRGALLAIQIQDLRKHQDLTLQDLADMAGIPLEILRDIELGVLEVGSEHVTRIRLDLKRVSEPAGTGF